MNIKVIISSILIFASGVSFGTECSNGSVIMWKYDQSANKIKPSKIKPSKVCHFIKEQKPHNILLEYFKNDQLVFFQKIFWDQFTTSENISNGKFTAKKFKTTEFKILKIPVAPDSFDHFTAKHIYSGDLMGKGKISE